jgi:hypothetical protein
MIYGKMVSMKNSDVDITFGGRVWITGKPRGDQKMTIIAFGADHLPWSYRPFNTGRELLLFVVDYQPEPRFITCKEMSPGAIFRRPERDEQLSS